MTPDTDIATLAAERRAHAEETLTVSMGRRAQRSEQAALAECDCEVRKLDEDCQVFEAMTEAAEVRADAAEAARDAALGDVERLRLAVKPFARFITTYDGDCRTHGVPLCPDRQPPPLCAGFGITAAEMRVAARVLAETAPADGGGADGH